MKGRFDCAWLFAAGRTTRPIVVAAPRVLELDIVPLGPGAFQVSFKGKALATASPQRGLLVGLTAHTRRVAGMIASASRSGLLLHLPMRTPASIYANRKSSAARLPSR
jgi:hypothetical protein